MGSPLDLKPSKSCVSLNVFQAFTVCAPFSSFTRFGSWPISWASYSSTSTFFLVSQNHLYIYYSFIPSSFPMCLIWSRLGGSPLSLLYMLQRILRWSLFLRCRRSFPSRKMSSLLFYSFWFLLGRRRILKCFLKTGVVIAASFELNSSKYFVSFNVLQGWAVYAPSASFTIFGTLPISLTALFYYLSSALTSLFLATFWSSSNIFMLDFEEIYSFDWA